jgi:hypothetical protein
LLGGAADSPATGGRRPHGIRRQHTGLCPPSQGPERVGKPTRPARQAPRRSHLPPDRRLTQPVGIGKKVAVRHRWIHLAAAAGCMSVLARHRKLVVPSPPARVGKLGQGCTDRQTPNTPGRRRVAGNALGRRRVAGNAPGRRCVPGHGFSRGTGSPPPPSPPPAGMVEVCPKASRPRGEGQGRGGRRKPPLKRWPVTRREHGNRSAPWGWAEQGRPQGLHQNADALARSADGTLAGVMRSTVGKRQAGDRSGESAASGGRRSEAPALAFSRVPRCAMICRRLPDGS